MQPNESQVLDRIVGWVRDNELIRAAILEGSRANPVATVDSFSDYDIAIVVADRTPFVEGDAWETWFGERLISWGDAGTIDGIERTMRLVIYADGTRIDYCIWAPEALRTMKERRQLPPILDTGYRVLLDKDGITADLPAATQMAHVPRMPDEAAFREFLDDFWLDAAYVAKSLKREQLLPAKFGLNRMIGLGHLRRLLEWRVEIDHQWSLAMGRHGRGLRHLAPADHWRSLERVFVGADPAENWEALWTALDLHRRTAIEVADSLGYSYPHERDKAVMAYLTGLRERDVRGHSTP